MKEARFLSLAEVIEVHKDQTQRYGGHTGIRDLELLKPSVFLELLPCNYSHKLSFKVFRIDDTLGKRMLHGYSRILIRRKIVSPG